MSKKLNIGYFADGPWSHEAFKKLIRDNEISIRFVCVRFDTQDVTLKQYCKKYNIDYLKDQNVNSAEFIEELSKYQCDLFVSMSFNQIFRKRLINFPRLQSINCHAGKLPFYRGRNILNWALINDEKEFGITVHYIDEGIDTGDILAQRLLPISDEDNYATLLERAFSGCAELLYEVVKKLMVGNMVPKPQEKIHPLGFYCTGRLEGDENLNWNQPSRDIYNFVRAVCRPGPEARTFCRGKEIKINRAEYLPEAPVYKGIAGAVLDVTPEAFYVKTADTYLKIVEWRGIDRIKIGDRLK